jgi:hypothetical protein
VCERLFAQYDGVVFGDLKNCIFHGNSFCAAPRLRGSPWFW